jgi:hypothetical protein
MYKYSKETKEKLFRDEIMSFLWAYFRLTNQAEDIMGSEENGGESSNKRDPMYASIDASSIPLIIDEFDRLAWATLNARGNEQLVAMIFERFNLLEGEKLAE